jgi:hypothetical protein
MSDGPSRLYLVFGGIVVAAIWITAGVFAVRGTWWPLIVVSCIAGSALVVSLGMALFVKGRSGRAAAPPAAATVGRDAPPPRPGGQVGPRGRGNKKRKRRKR